MNSNNTRHASTEFVPACAPWRVSLFWGTFVQFTKPPLSLDAQIDLLIERGLHVPDRAQARHYLTHINYYRLRGYWLPFEVASEHAEHRFRPGTRFDHVIALYVFDRHLRLLLLDLIERVEVAVRTQWAYQLAMRHGAHAHLNANLFRDLKQYATSLKTLKDEVKHSRETFIEHYRNTYTQPDLPPIWAISEVISMGQLSKWFQNLKHREDRQAIARVMQIDEWVLCSFLHHLTLVRNLCAHHSRIWNRHFAITMKFPKHPLSIRDSINPAADRQLYNTLVMLSYFMRIISPDSQWRAQFLTLLEQYPQVQPRAMGFPENWQARAIW